ncbi:hypothetical protein AX16_004524 [Volvariella volvacea WC 439]|nr:hypothetical protein AX16_004524 [Volvariella volvacea WC 439]
MGDLQKEMELPLRKRIRRFATVPHFIRLGTQLWGRDWATYGRPGDRVDLWAEIQLNVFTSARVGEYIESTARAGSGRGLRYRDVSFGIFRNEYGDPEFAMQVVKDAKGLEERPLFCNPILTHLAMFLAKGAFRDYKTMEELLALQPSNEEEMFLLRWEPHMLDLPIYQRKDGKTESASTFSNRLRSLGRRAGYDCPPTIHDFRAEALHCIDKFYTSSQRMRAAGHRDDRTYTDFYAPTNPGTDGQGSYLGGTRRTVVNELFRSLTVAWNPELAQSLPAEMMFELEHRPDFAAIEQRLRELCLGVGSDGPDATKERTLLQAQKRQLLADELRRLQRDQPRDIARDSSDSDTHIGHLRTMFPRIRKLMGPRDRLADNLLVTAPIRSDVGRAVLDDLISLYKQTSEIEVRAGLEPEKCRCVHGCKRVLPSNARDAKRSRHVYGCVKKHLQSTRSFGEFCFLCNEWFDKATRWESHCQSHLDREPPTQCNPFAYDKCIASPGFCPWCLGDTQLDAASRMIHFVEAREWRAHVESHISALDERVSARKAPLPLQLRCPHPRPQCDRQTFDSVQRLVFHLQDVHCWMRGTSRPRRSCRTATPDEVAAGDGDGDEEPHQQQEEEQEDFGFDEYEEEALSDDSYTLDSRSDSLSTASSFSIPSPPPVHSSSIAPPSSWSRASWPVDQGRHTVFYDPTTSYPSFGNPGFQDMRVDDPRYYLYHGCDVAYLTQSAGWPPLALSQSHLLHVAPGYAPRHDCTVYH